MTAKLFRKLVSLVVILPLALLSGALFQGNELMMGILMALLLLLQILIMKQI